MPSNDIIEGESRAIATVDHGVPARWSAPLIDIDGEKERLDNFREFIATVLDPAKGHFGKMPGVDHAFLQQPGAEIIYRALEARPSYSLVQSQIDWEGDFCYFLVKCQVVHSTSGVVMGEAVGSCSSLEYATTCYLVRRPQEENDDGVITCPEHGTHKGNNFWDNKARKRMVVCAKKNPAPLSRTLQNVQSKANKRAMVGAIRTVGCVSEIFTQDEDMMAPRGGGSDEGDAPAEEKAARPPRAPRGKKADAPAKEAPAAVEVPEDAYATPLEAGDAIKAMFAAFKEKEVGGGDVKAFLEDAGETFAADEKITGGRVDRFIRRLTNKDYLSKPGVEAFTKAVIARFGNDPEPEPAEEAAAEEAPAAEAEVDIDAIPFE